MTTDEMRDQQYAKTLQRLIRMETVSVEGDRNTEKFERFHSLLQELFPNLFDKSDIENFSGSLLMRWPGECSEAIRFYSRKGYEKVYDLVYYSHSDPSGINADLPSGFTVKRTDIDALRSFSREIRDMHINWQNDFDYTSHFDEQVYYGAFEDANMAGGLSIHPAGRVNFLWVDPGFRNKGEYSRKVTGKPAEC